MPDGNEIYGRSILAGGSSAGAIKWTVSQTEPSKPKAGDVWIVGNKPDYPITKVIHIQTDRKTVDNAQPNTIYILIPARSFPTVEDDREITFFDSKKYFLRVKVPYMFVTGSSGEELEAVRGIYDGTEWRMWGLKPEIPTEWTLQEAINTSTTWTPPENTWYRVHVWGKSGDGYPYQTSGGASSGHPSGGYACSVLLIEAPVVCTINASLTSFGEYLSATSSSGGTIGTGTNGTEYNLSGFAGGAPGKQGENNGCSGNSGGGGARVPVPYDPFPYVPETLSNYRAGGSAYYAGAGSNATPYPALDLSNPKIYGGGCGNGNDYYRGTDPTWGPMYYYGGAGSLGSPGLIIIEKGVL